MGAVIGSILAAALPEAIEHIVLVDSLGPYTRQIRSIDRISVALRERDKIVARQPLIYPTRPEAEAKYRRNNPFISERGASLLLERGMTAVVSPVGKVGFKFRHDPRLVANSPHGFREEEVLELLSSIQCPVILVIASSTSLQYSNMKFPANIAKFQKRANAVKDLEVLKIDGSHHVHLDNPEVFAQKVVDFFLSPIEKENPDVEKLKVPIKQEDVGDSRASEESEPQAVIPKAKL